MIQKTDDHGIKSCDMTDAARLSAARGGLGMPICSRLPDCR
jgi:hypothetical protein